jgi:hypothetical protein
MHPVELIHEGAELYKLKPNYLTLVILLAHSVRKNAVITG